MSTDDTNTNDRHEEEPGGRGRRGQGGRGPRGRHGPGPGPRRGGPFGRPGGWQQADLPDASGAAEWFAGRLPDGWYVAPPEIVVDRDEITVVGELAPVDGGEEAAEGRITRWREDTRGQRMAIADLEAELERGAGDGSVREGAPAVLAGGIELIARGFVLAAHADLGAPLDPWAELARAVDGYLRP